MTNPVSSTDRVFLRHFSMVIGFLILVMIGLIALAMHIYGNHPAPPRPEAQQEIAARIAPAGAGCLSDAPNAETDSAIKVAQIVINRVMYRFRFLAAGVRALLGPPRQPASRRA